jgi:hypothetical protein
MSYYEDPKKLKDTGNRPGYREGKTYTYEPIKNK